MALVKCRECGGEVSTEAQKCPKCGAVVRGRASAVGVVVSALVIAGAAWYFFGGGLEQQASRSMDDITRHVAEDAVTQYGIAKRNGQAADACAAAMSVSAAYLQAKDESAYRRWHDVEQQDCQDAGMTGR